MRRALSIFQSLEAAPAAKLVADRLRNGSSTNLTRSPACNPSQPGWAFRPRSPSAHPVGRRVAQRRNSGAPGHIDPYGRPPRVGGTRETRRPKPLRGRPESRLTRAQRHIGSPSEADAPIRRFRRRSLRRPSPNESSRCPDRVESGSDCRLSRSRLPDTRQGRGGRAASGQRLPSGFALLGEAEAIERQLRIALALQCADTVGGLDRVFEFTLDYMNDRYAFGRPISSYQALKHRVADLLLHLESAKACCDAAVAAFDEGRGRRHRGERCQSIRRFQGVTADPEMHGVPRRHLGHLGTRPSPLPQESNGEPCSLRYP